MDWILVEMCIIDFESSELLVYPSRYILDKSECIYLSVPILISIIGTYRRRNRLTEIK